MRLIDAEELHKKIMMDAGNDLSQELTIAQCLLYMENAPTIETGKLIDKSTAIQRLCAACSNMGSFACVSCAIPNIIKGIPSIKEVANNG